MKKPILSSNGLFAPRKYSRTPAARPVRPRVEELEPRLALSSLPTPDHVVLVIEENHGFSQIIGSPNAPYINGLASQGALMTNSHAIEHPSQPNYLDLFSGSNQGITNDSVPTNLPFSTPNLGAELLQQGLSFATYSEDLPSVGFTGATSGAYARKHNPEVNWQDTYGTTSNSIPASANQPFSSFPTDFSSLPTVSIVVPNLNDDMHNGTIAQGDTWLQQNLSAYADWAQSNNSLLIVTWDENDGSAGNQIPTIFYGANVVPGQYDEAIDHYTVLRTIEDMYGLPYAGQSANVDPITDIWTTNTASATHFAFTPSVSSVTAGTPFDVTVTALDANNNPVPSYTGTVHFTSGDPYGAALPADYTFTAADQGVHSFTAGATLYTAGAWDVTGTDTASGITSSANLQVTPASAVQFAVTAPSQAATGAPFDLTVTALDPYGNTDTNYQGTVTFGTTDPDPGVVLPADYTFTAADQGTHTFSGGVTLVTPGDQILTAVDTADNTVSGNTVVTVGGAAPGTGPHWLGQAPWPGSLQGTASRASEPPHPGLAALDRLFASLNREGSKLALFEPIRQVRAGADSWALESFRGDEAWLA